MDTKALRQKILDLAIRGKLVPQDPNDEPAAVLLERIREQKRQMVKEGKLKEKDVKNDTVIFVGEDNLHYEKFQDGTVKCIEDEIPFEVPEGWEWCRGYSILCGMKTRKPIGNSFRYIDIDAIDNKTHSVRAPKVIETVSAPSRASRAVESGNILFSLVRPYLENIAYVTEELQDCIVSTGFYVCNFSTNLNPDYMFQVMTSNYVISGLNQYMKGDNSPSINADNIEKWLYPIAPLVEQARIASRCKELLELVANIELDKSSLSNILATARRKILDLAIRGKLVPQDPNDEPASVLLERIRAEKEELIKQGKIKRNKKESVIYKGDDNSYYERFPNGDTSCINNEIPFDIPKSWAWCRLQNITSILTDGTHKTPTYSNEGYIFLSSKNVTNGYIDWDNVMYIPNILHQELHSRLSPQVNDILLAKNGTTGVAALVDKDCVFDIYVSLALIRIVNNIILPQYILRVIESSSVQNYFNESLKGIGVPNLHLEHIRRTLIPIPPYKEQLRISKKINIFLNKLGKIEVSLK